MTNMGMTVKIAVTVLVLAALVASRLSSNHQDELPPAGAKKSTRNLKGSRRAQNFDFTGGFLSGGGGGGGNATGIGNTVGTAVGGLSNAFGNGSFDTKGGGSGFIDTAFGSAKGSGVGGATGSQDGVGNVANVGTNDFTGTSKSFGSGTFGSGFSLPTFQSTTTTIPGVASGNSKKTTIGPPTTSTIFTPVPGGPTGGFGGGLGTFDISSTAGGTTGEMDAESGGTSTGAATTFGGGTGSAIDFFGTAGGLGSGTGFGGGVGGGAASGDGGTFTGVGTADGNFGNVGQGVFGIPGMLTFP